MNEPRTKRRYHSPQRQEQAQLTRRKILEAARCVFAARGYAATTLPTIAREAGVSAPTVTAVFGTKVGVLEALIQLVVRGDVDSTPLADRSWWQEMLAEPEPSRQLRLQARMVRQIHERSADVYEIVRGASTAEPEMAQVVRRRGTLRLQDTRAVAESLAEKQALAPGVSVEQATDLLWALESAELYRLLVAERGWRSDQYEDWLGSTLIRSLLG